jgi:alanyl-tRNA synthetase
MIAMYAQQIRETYLDFFARRGHKIVPSSPLLPKDDPTLLFTNAGMNQFKSVFLGRETRSYTRAATVQKCLRVSGKHNDLEQVGRTSKHHTFFEMLGNFSFGDYFKRAAVAFAWELVTEVFKLDRSRLFVTVYEEDEEAFDLWNKEIGVPAGRIFRFGKKENFWAMGDTGPCGPCSEFHYDLNPALEAGEPRALIGSGSDRFIELWNLVFMQFERDASGAMTPLPKPSIDTGMGLERMAAVLQGRTSNWDTDLFAPLIGEVVSLAGCEYPAGDADDVSVRVVADHARAAAFMIGDGIMPANDGRGYVLRRLIRRAYRHGNRLGLDEPFVYKLMGTVAEGMKSAYPELLTALPFIAKICRAEEDRFSRTLASGLRVFHQFAAEARRNGGGSLSGEAAFKLYDTYGFPLDLTQDLAQEERMGVDEAGFAGELEKQKTRARQSWKGDDRMNERRIYEDLQGAGARFSGYDTESVAEAKVLALVRDGARVERLGEGEAGEVVLDRTPFYAEAGGQIGDAGVLKNARFSAVVENAFYPVPDLRAHKVRVIAGTLRVGEGVEAVIDHERRKAVRDNHTATHLLHAALREVLGDHVKQAGSLVSPSRLRFDFAHFQGLSPEEIDRVEVLVNARIRDDTPVVIREMSLEEGLREGAMAIFEEKYGERVRLVAVGDFSKELCGGAHAPLTGEIGLFKIVSETSVAAGLRRIEALTGEEALHHVQQSERLLADAARLLNVPRKDVTLQIEKLRDQAREKDHEIRGLRQKMLTQSAAEPAETARTIGGVSVLVQKIEGLNPGEARGLADDLKRKIGSGVVILGAVQDDKAFLIAGVTKDLSGRISAAEIIKAIAPLIGGGGGGRPDFAQAGGPKTGELDRALAEGLNAVERILGAA